MNSQDNKMTATSKGHEVHLCHLCGWPFPKPHPSAKHIRAHKKLCGTIEGYKIIHSEEHVSYNDHSSDEHTPNPKVLKKTAEDFGSSEGVGARSNKSEDDVFSDAVTEFSDSGISPRLEERFESVRELDKILEQKRLEAHLNGNESVNVDTTADTTKQVNDQTKSAEGTSVGFITGLQPYLVKLEIPMDNKSEYVNGESKQGQTTDVSALITFELEEVRISDQTEKKEELCDKLVSDQTEKTIQNLDPSAEISVPVKTVCEIAHSEETRDNSDSYVAVNTSPEECLLSTPFVESDGLTEQYEAKSLVSSIEIKFNKNQNLEESKDNYSVDKMLRQLEFAVDKESNNVNRSDEKSGYVIYGTRTENVEGAPVGPIMPSNDSTDLLSSREAADLVEPSKTESNPLELRENGSDKKNFERLDTVYFDVGGISDLEDNVEAVSSEGSTEQRKSEEPVYAAQVCAKLNNHNGEEEKSEKSNPSGQEEALSVKDDLNETSPGVEDVLPPFLPPLAVRKNSNEVCAANSIDNVDDDLIIDSKSLQAEVDENLDSQEVGVAAVGLSANNSSSRADISEIEDDVEAVSSKGTTEQKKSEEPVYAAQVCAELNNHNGDEEKLKCNPSGQEEALPVKKEGSDGTSPDVEDALPPLDVRKDSNEACAANSVVNVDDYVIVSKSLQAEVDKKLDSQEVGVAAVNLSANNSSSRADSLEMNCVSVSDSKSPNTLETDFQKSKTTTVEAQAPPDKSDTFEAPSFMTLVQSRGKDNNDQDSAVSEIETVKNNQRPRSDDPQAGWFPSLTNVLNESEGRKKNEEIIAKVTKWSPVKQHGPLKNLLNEVKSLDTEKVKDRETDDSRDNDADADVAITDATAVVVGPTDQKDAQIKDVEQWNSPARYPVEIKKETKKKGRSLWVLFVCCSSVHRDL